MRTLNAHCSNQYQNITSNLKKSRQGRRNERQLSFLVDYMSQNPHLATGKLNSLHGNYNLRGSWEDLVLQLNNLRNPGVKKKDLQSWKKTWRDLKAKVFKQASVLQNSKRLIGNKNISIPELTDREKKVLNCAYVKGITCPDSFPDDQLEDLERLVAGDYTILDAESTNDKHINEVSEENFELNLKEPTLVELQTPSNSPDQMSSKINTHKRKQKSQNQNNTNNTNDKHINEVSEENFELNLKEPTLVELQTPSNSPDQMSSKINTHKRKQKSQNQNNTNNTIRKKLRTQFGDARESFTKRTETNVQYIDNLSQSISQLASAMTRMAENDDRRLRNEESMLAVMKQLIEKMPSHFL